MPRSMVISSTVRESGWSLWPKSKGARQTHLPVKNSALCLSQILRLPKALYCEYETGKSSLLPLLPSLFSRGN